MLQRNERRNGEKKQRVIIRSRERKKEEGELKWDAMNWYGCIM